MSVVFLNSRRIASVIANYEPRRSEVANRLSENGLELVRKGVTAVSPPDAHSAAVMCSYVAAHVGWAIGAGGFEPSIEAVFSADALRGYVMDSGVSGSHPDATACSVVERVARAAAPLAGHVPMLSVPGGGLAQPYSSSEQAMMVAAAQGLANRYRPSTVAGLSVGAGAGLVGPRADHLRRELVRLTAQTVLVPDAETGIWLPVDPWWSDRLRASLDERDEIDAAGEVVDGSYALTTLFTKGGAARVRYAMRRAAGTATIVPSRLRSTWLANLFDSDLPIDVVAAAAGIDVPRALMWDSMLDKCHEPESVRMWLGAPGLASQAPPTSAFTGLPPIGARTRRRSDETVFERLDRYRPVEPSACELWVGPIGEQVTELIASVTDDAILAFDLASAFCQLAGWAATTPGIPLHVEVLLRESLIQRYTAAQGSILSPVAATSRRTHLRTLSRAIHGPQRSAPRPPRTRSCRALDPDEYASLCGAAAALGPTADQVLDAALVIGAGAGLEIASGFTMTSQDLREVDGIFELHHDGRWHPVANRQHDAARRVAAVRKTSDGNAMLTPANWTRLQRELTRTCGISVGSVAFRHTWALHQLQRNVPASVIRQALGGSGNGLISVAAKGIASRRSADITAWLARPIAGSAK